MARKFLANGDVVIGTSRSGECDVQHERLTMLPLELAEAASIAACVETMRKMGKKIDVLINNAGIWDERDDGPGIDTAALQRTLAVNLVGVVDFTERLVPLLNDGGHVVNVTSRRGSMERTLDVLYPAYSIAKAGLNMYTRKLAARMQGKATVICVHPGSVRTAMNPEGEIAVEESASDIISLIRDDLPTGGFWYKGERFPW